MSRRERAALLATIGLTALLAVAAHAGSATATANSVELLQAIGNRERGRPRRAADFGDHRVRARLRVMVFHAGTDCRIEIGGVVAPLMNLRRGQIVAVRYWTATEPSRRPKHRDASRLGRRERK